MKKNKLTLAVVAGIAGVTGIANAQQFLNPEGTGEVLVYPYYTVNNGIDTNYSVVNTTNLTKAIKVRFLEGQNSVEVLDFNVYMSPFDVWTGVLVNTTSSISDGLVDHVGEPSAYHTTSDTSCAPRLEKARQEFLPYAIDNSQLPFGLTNNSMQRGTEGHIEVIEMATFAPAGPAATSALHAATGTEAAAQPANCNFFVTAWDDGNFDDNDASLETTGGLFGSASIVNVAEGLSMTYDAVAIDNFWEAGDGSHTPPGDLSPSISNGDTSITIFDDGVATTSIYPSGAQAVSGLFMNQQIFNEYALDSFVAGKSEWVVTFPTKNPHVNRPPALGAILPFYNVWDGDTACHEFGLAIYDREEQFEIVRDGVSPPRPGGADEAFCYESNVLEFRLPETPAGATSGIFGSSNQITVPTLTDPGATENGFAIVTFDDDSTRPYVDVVGYNGLPVVGFAAQQQTNAGAGEGLLAQYAGLFKHKGSVVLSN